MPATLTHPGVYIEELPSGVHSITGVSTSVTAFVGYFSRGPMDEAVRIYNYGDFDRIFGGLRADSEASYAIQQFFLNGGTQAWVVRVAKDSTAAKSSITLDEDGGDDVLTASAASEGAWGNNLSIKIEHVATDSEDDGDSSAGGASSNEAVNSDPLFNLVASEGENGPTETFRNLSMVPASPAYAVDVVNAGSTLIRLSDADATKPTPAPTETTGDTGISLAGGNDGTAPDADDLIGKETEKTGIYALLTVDVFNILCIPRIMKLEDDAAGTVASAAAKYCEQQRAFYIIDVPEATGGTAKDEKATRTWLAKHRGKNVAAYYPRPEIADALKNFRLRPIAASGTLAGLYARTDSERGVWKAPAGTEASLRGVPKLEAKLTDGENGTLNQKGVNCLRNFPVYGNVCWGARTLDGADAMASEWKYIPVRRTALFIEESLYRGMQWAVFEGNDESLWGQIRLNVGAFMQTLFRQGAFAGASANKAYFVKCDSETTTQADVNNGIVNLVVGFAPLKPAEFVVIKLQQIAGQIDT